MLLPLCCCESIFLLPELEDPYLYTELGMGRCGVCKVRTKDMKRYKKRQKLKTLQITSSPLMLNSSFHDPKDANPNKPCIHNLFYGVLLSGSMC